MANLLSEKLAKAIFEEIKHGDDEHKAWLLDALLGSKAISDFIEEQLRDYDDCP